LIEPVAATALIWAALNEVHSEVEHGVKRMRVRGTSPIFKSDTMAAYRPIVAEKSRKRIAPTIAEAGTVAPPLELSDVGTFQVPDPVAKVPPYHNPVLQKEIGDLCEQAAAHGEVEAGALLPSSQKSAKKAGK
jgi:hypothetical protein